MNRACVIAAVVAVAVLNAAVGYAHSLVSTIVSVIVDRPGIVMVTIAAEADPLIAKLETLAGVPPSNAATTAERRVRLESLFPTLRAHIDARIAGTPLAFELRDVAVDDTAQVEMHLTARMPGASPMFTWRSTFIFGAYQLAITSGHAAEFVQWLQGPQTSTPIALEPSHSEVRSSALWLTRIGHGLAMGALVVFVLLRRRSAHRLAGG
jgi:hypothetical protein